MFHRELKINYGMLGDLISNIESYQSALSVMKQSVEKIWELLEESSGEAYEGLEERKETILGQISSCEEELTDLHDLLAGYSYDMQSVIAPVDGEQTMVVDRNDIWFNMQSILSACDRIAAMVYNVNVPWLGTTYTAFAKEEVKEKETKYYNKLEEVQQKIQKKYQDSIAGYKDELVKLYEDKVIVYENTDDVYASKVSKDYYPKYTSLGEGILNVFEWLGDAVTSFVGGVIEGVIGVIDGIGEFLFGIGEFAVSECVVLVNKGMGSEPPDWALKNVKGMKEQVGAILDDPMLLVEGMAQGISDTYESEGIWYCAGYAVGTYAGTKGIAEAGKAVKGKVKVKGKVGESGSKTYKEVNIHGRINTEIDEVDLVNQIIYEDKSAGKLYMENADFPQTEQQWAFKQIYKKGSNRIDAINQSEYNLSIVGSESVPDINSLKNIRNYTFRIDADTPALRQAVEQCLDKLREKYPEYNFSATYGGK